MKQQCYNPYLPGWEYIPDAEPRLFDGRLYVFGSHDRFGSKDYCAGDYVAWSAPEDDLSDWRYEGVIYRKEQTPWNRDKRSYYAPDVVRGTDRRYYLYYSVANSSVTSVAVCDTPAGKYTYLGDVQLPDGRVYGSRAEDWFVFDPAVLVDDDGRVYLYVGSGQPSNGRFCHKVVGLFVMELEQDMLTIKSEPTILLPADFNAKKSNYWEGPSIRHIGCWYYLVYPATNITGLNYATSLFPDKGFIHQGPIHSSSDIGYRGRKLMDAAYPMGNSHGGLVCVKGQWYIFDHRTTNGKWKNRQAVAEPITIAQDGRIAMVESTSCGLNGGPLSGKGCYPASIACCLRGGSVLGFRNPMGGPFVTQDGPDYEPPEPADRPVTGCTQADAPRSLITEIRNGCVMGYKYFDLTKTTGLAVTVRGGKGYLELLGGEEGKAIAEFILSPTTDWTTYRILFSPDQLAAAADCPVNRCPVYLRYRGKDKLDLLDIAFV